MNDSTIDWTKLIPSTRGNLPGGAPLRRTDPGGASQAPIAFLGVYPAATKVRAMTVGGGRMNLLIEVEATSFEADSASGSKLDEHYLAPLGLTRSQVFITDLLPYFLANTKPSKGSGRSMADNVRAFEAATGATTGIEARPTPENLLRLTREMPGNLDRLRSYFGACRPRLLFTLGTEPAAFVRGLSFEKAAKDVDRLLYGPPVEVEAFGIETKVVHLVHPHLFIKRNTKWTARHREWIEREGRALASKAVELSGSPSSEVR